MKLRVKRYIVFLAALLSAIAVHGDVIFSSSSERILPGKDLYILAPDQELDLQKVASSNAFQPNTAEVANAGLRKHSVWFRFTIKNEGQAERLLLNLAYPRFEEVSLSVLQNGRFSTTSVRNKQGFSKRPYDASGFIFDLHIPRGESRTYYLRVKGKEPIFLPLYLGSEKSVVARTGRDNMLSGIYMGIVLIMVFYNLFIYLSVKDRSYIYYVVYVLFAGLTQFGLKGYNFQYLWPGDGAFDTLSVTLFGAIGGLAALLFTRNFLELKKRHSRFNILILTFSAFFILSILAVCAGFTTEAFKAMQITTSISSVGVFCISIILMLKGYRGAKFFFYAWSVLLAGAVIFLLKDYGLLPYNTFTSYSVQGASAIEMALLSFGLADRINILKREKEMSQAEALRVAKENERIIREQNVLLEQKVHERTLELQDANEELNATLEDLKQAQSQLVESEKMASLGQLTAGIAHEINNPVNFVSSNVNPLRRDIDLLLDAMAAIEKVALSEAGSGEKEKEIESIKEDLDFDYLKVEITHLLKGIHEGASRTAEIVKGLRIFSRVDEDDLKKADVTAGLESTLVIINNLTSNKIAVIRKFSDLPAIECYPGKLNQVFLNILTNAVHAVVKKFGERPGGKITISTHCDNTHVYVTIADNGTGMDDHVKRKIFEPFFTTKDVGEGTGLGMSIAYNTIGKHNGDIIVESTLGEGTRFVLQLPITHKS